MNNQTVDQVNLLQRRKPKKPKKLPISELLEVSGNAHTYQKRIIAMFIVVQFFYGFIYSMIPYLYFGPTFHCRSEDGSLHECSEMKACANEYGYETSSERYSLVTRFHLYCDNKYLDTYGKNFIFAFSAICCLFVTAYSDYRGRKMIYLLSCLSLVIGGILGMSDDYVTIVVGMAFCFLAMELFLTFAYVYLNEIVGTSLRSRSAPIIQLSIGLGIIASNVCSLFTKGYYVSFLPCCIINGLLIVVYCYLAESPYFLDKREDKQLLYECLHNINNINYRDNEQLREQNKSILKKIILRDTCPIADNFNDQQEDAEDSETKLVIKKDPELNVTKIIIMIIQICIICSNIAIVFGLVMIAIQYLGSENIHFNSFAFTLTIPVAVLYAIKNAPRIKRRKCIIFQNISIILLSFLLIALRKSQLFENSLGKSLDVVLCVAIMAGSAVVNSLLSTYVSELFPTDVRGLALGADVFISRLSYIGSSYLALLSQYFDLNPMSFCFIPAFMSLVAVYGLKETLNPKGYALI